MHLFLSESADEFAEESALECAEETAGESAPIINLKQFSQRLVLPNLHSSVWESGLPQYSHFICINNNLKFANINKNGFDALFILRLFYVVFYEIRHFGYSNFTIFV